MKARRVREISKSDWVFTAFLQAFMWFWALVIAYPLIYIVSASFSSPEAVSSGAVWLWPVEPTLRGYESILQNRQLMNGFVNSFFYTGLGTVISVTLTILLAFPLSRQQMVGKNVFTWMLVFTMLFSGGLIPTYMVVKGLGMLDTFWAIVLPSAIGAWNVFIARSYFRSLPEELYEAATIDGIDDLGHFVKIVLPLSAPIIAVISLFAGVQLWNGYYGALIYLSNDQLYPLQLVLRAILVMGNIDPATVTDPEALTRLAGLSDLLKYAVIVVASVPVLLFYPLIQRYFVRGMMVGSIKG